MTIKKIECAIFCLKKKYTFSYKLIFYTNRIVNSVKHLLYLQWICFNTFFSLNRKILIISQKCNKIFSWKEENEKVLFLFRFSSVWFWNRRIRPSIFSISSKFFRDIKRVINKFKSDQIYFQISSCIKLEWKVQKREQLFHCKKNYSFHCNIFHLLIISIIQRWKFGK